MNNTPIIAPSILAANFKNLSEDIKKINTSNAQWIHVDIMDGLFVPNISFGFPILEAVVSLSQKYIDVHLMIEQPNRYFETFKRFGASSLSIHYERNSKLLEDLLQIKSMGMGCGLVLNPDTPYYVIEPFLETIDFVLIMSVFPGFGGQKFIKDTFQKVIDTKQLIIQSGFNIKIQVDGGVSIENSKQLIEAGADILVCGSALFQSDNFSNYVEALQG